MKQKIWLGLFLVGLSLVLLAALQSLTLFLRYFLPDAPECTPQGYLHLLLVAPWLGPLSILLGFLAWRQWKEGQ